MKTVPRASFLVLVCLALTICGCSPGSPTQAPVVNTPTQDLVTASAAPVLQDPTSTTSAPVDEDLSEAEILEIVRYSLAAFPWRLEQSLLSKGTGQTTTTLTEAQSSRRGYNQSVQTLGSETITVESMLIDSTVYLKITGSPAETYGLVDGQWTDVPPDSSLAQLVDRGAIDPARVAETFAADFASMPVEGGSDGLLFKIVGSETVSGVTTNIYEASGANFSYRWWIGADGRFYKTAVEIPEATRTILIEYDPGINIQPPNP